MKQRLEKQKRIINETKVGSLKDHKIDDPLVKLIKKGRLKSLKPKTKQKQKRKCMC